MLRLRCVLSFVKLQTGRNGAISVTCYILIYLHLLSKPLLEIFTRDGGDLLQTMSPGVSIFFPVEICITEITEGKYKEKEKKMDSGRGWSSLGWSHACKEGGTSSADHLGRPDGGSVVLPEKALRWRSPQGAGPSSMGSAQGPGSAMFPAQPNPSGVCGMAGQLRA